MVSSSNFCSEEEKKKDFLSIDEWFFPHWNSISNIKLSVIQSLITIYLTNLSKSPKY